MGLAPVARGASKVPRQLRFRLEKGGVMNLQPVGVPGLHEDITGGSPWSSLAAARHFNLRQARRQKALRWTKRLRRALRRRARK